MKKFMAIVGLLLSVACLQAGPDAKEGKCTLGTVAKAAIKPALALGAAVAAEETAHRKLGLSRRDLVLVGAGTAVLLYGCAKGYGWVAGKWGKSKPAAAKADGQ
jgi:hypothetical protein